MKTVRSRPDLSSFWMPGSLSSSSRSSSRPSQCIDQRVPTFKLTISYYHKFYTFKPCRRQPVDSHCQWFRSQRSTNSPSASTFRLPPSPISRREDHNVNVFLESLLSSLTRKEARTRRQTNTARRQTRASSVDSVDSVTVESRHVDMLTRRRQFSVPRTNLPNSLAHKHTKSIL